MEEKHFRFRTHMRHSAAGIIGWVIIGIIGAAAFAFVFGYFVMLLWNWLMPALFGLALINFWKAVGIVFLARMIFGGFGHGHKHRSDRRNHHRDFEKYHHFSDRCCGKKRAKFSRWNYYEEFWKSEGEDAFNKFIEKKQQQNPEKEQQNQ
jgi:hypothetical protein